MTETTPCVRGCTLPRQHVTDCEDRDTCRGCLPRTVHRSGVHLCEPCHLRLSTSLAEVPGQHDLLLSTTAPSQEMRVRPQPRHGRPDYWPTESEAARYIYSHGTTASAPQEGEPVRIACLDTAQALSDLMSEWVVWVCDAHGRTGPRRLTTRAEDEGRARWTDPPPTIDVWTAVRWLRASLEWVESLPAIGDMMEDLRELMGQAHALAPWREQVRRIDGIPCPSCHRHTLRQYGGRDTVTCVTPWCREEIPQERYLIWARIYEEEAGA